MIQVSFKTGVPNLAPTQGGCLIKWQSFIWSNCFLLLWYHTPPVISFESYVSKSISHHDITCDILIIRPWYHIWYHNYVMSQSYYDITVKLWLFALKSHFAPACIGVCKQLVSKSEKIFVHTHWLQEVLGLWKVWVRFVLFVGKGEFRFRRFKTLKGSHALATRAKAHCSKQLTILRLHLQRYPFWSLISLLLGAVKLETFSLKARCKWCEGFVDAEWNLIHSQI